MALMGPPFLIIAHLFCLSCLCFLPILVIFYISNCRRTKESPNWPLGLISFLNSWSCKGIYDVIIIIVIIKHTSISFSVCFILFLKKESFMLDMKTQWNLSRIIFYAIVGMAWDKRYCSYSSASFLKRLLLLLLDHLNEWVVQTGFGFDFWCELYLHRRTKHYKFREISSARIMSWSC